MCDSSCLPLRSLLRAARGGRTEAHSLQINVEPTALLTSEPATRVQDRTVAVAEEEKEKELKNKKGEVNDKVKVEPAEVMPSPMAPAAAGLSEETETGHADTPNLTIEFLNGEEMMHKVKPLEALEKDVLNQRQLCPGYKVVFFEGGNIVFDRDRFSSGPNVHALRGKVLNATITVGEDFESQILVATERSKWDFLEQFEKYQMGEVSEPMFRKVEQDSLITFREDYWKFMQDLESKKQATEDLERRARFAFEEVEEVLCALEEE